MQVFALTGQILLIFFAIIGVHAFFRGLADTYTQKRAGAVCRIYLDTCKGDVEYAVRFAESRFIQGDYAAFFDGMMLSDSLDLDVQTFDRLNREFGNLTLKH